ncbi:MAG: hypothetical protein ATN35_02140 [Epulopiscium sp. Nele67-Bin004]|nr:MAG: hypothetical protein ATN35_02140 [Epulopiscium sp. Nele67-Bin004]
MITCYNMPTDDVLYFDTRADFPTAGLLKKLYIDLDKQQIFYFLNNEYLELSHSLPQEGIDGQILRMSDGVASWYTWINDNTTANNNVTWSSTKLNTMFNSKINTTAISVATTSTSTTTVASSSAAYNASRSMYQQASGTGNTAQRSILLCSQYSSDIGTSYTTTALKSDRTRIQASSGNIYTAGSFYAGQSSLSLTDDLPGTIAAMNMRTDGTIDVAGADYAEYFEWLDNCNDDRTGLMVTLKRGKITLAQNGDDVLGIISANPNLIGNSDNNHWSGMYKKDNWGRDAWETIEETEEVEKFIDDVMDDDVILDTVDVGIVKVRQTVKYKHKVLSNDYDSTRDYKSRSERADEWGVVGLMGQMILIDDGTCEIDSYVNIGTNGVATKSRYGYKVMERVDARRIKVYVHGVLQNNLLREILFNYGNRNNRATNNNRRISGRNNINLCLCAYKKSANTARRKKQITSGTIR